MTLAPLRWPERRRWAVLLLLSLLSSAMGCSSRPAADNLLLVSFDTTRADRLSIYGYQQPTSPELAKLAKAGVVFDRTFSHVPSTLPEHTTILTGLLPPTHGVRCNGKYRLNDDVVTLAQRLSGAGFATASILGAFPLERRFGLAKGFDLYDDDFAASATDSDRAGGRMDRPGSWIGHDYLDFERSAKEVTDRALAWLEGRRPRWFVFVHYFDAHWPYEPQQQWRDRFRSPYDAEIAYADHHLGRLLDAVRAMPGKTLVVFTADHGEGLGEHDEMMHNRFVYQATTRVPLVVALDPKTGGRRVEQAVGHVDLLPTILELLGRKLPPGLAGRSLAPLVLEAAPIAPKDYYLETLVWNLERPRGIEVRAVVAGGYKLIETQRAPNAVPARRLELYDLEADPAERHDLLASGSRMREMKKLDMERRLTQWKQKLQRGSHKPIPIILDPAAREKLRSLGYL